MLANYNVYIGVPAHNKHYIGTLQNTTEEDAYEYAQDLAYEEYERYAGLHGIPSYSECRQEIIDEYAPEIESGEYDEDDIDFLTEEQYKETIESWTLYYIKEEFIDNEFSSDLHKVYLN